MNYDIKQEEGYILVTINDTLDKVTLLSAYASLQKNKHYIQCDSVIWDFSRVTSELSYTDTEELAIAVVASSKTRSDYSQCALVIIDPIDKLTFQNYITATSHSPVEFKIFEDIKQAKDWVLS